MKYRTTLVMVITTALIKVVRSQFNNFTGDPAFTAMWYTKEDSGNWDNNDFGYLDLVNTTTLPMIPFGNFNGHFPASAHLIPSGLQNQLDEYGIHIIAKCSPPLSGIYKLSLSADDGVRFLSNGRRISDSWAYSIHPYREYIVEMNLLESEEYLWEIHYFERTGYQGMEFKVEVNGSWEYVNSDWCTPATLPASTNFGGRAYRALDWTPPSSKDDSCQGNGVDSATFLYHDVPVESNDIYALLSRFKFGTQCMIVRNATSTDLFVALKTRPVDLTPANRYCDMTGKQVYRMFGSFRLSGDTNCDFRFLIETDLDPSLPDLSYKYTVHSGVHTLFFKEALFATLQNAAPPLESSSIMNYVAFKLPPGYAVAPNDGLTKAALLGSAYKFGVECIMLADGTALNTATGMLCSVDSGIDAVNIPGYYAVTGSDVADVFIKNPSGQRHEAILSWDETNGGFVPTIGTHLVESDGWLYGAVTGVAPNLDSTNGCQNRASEVQTGYSLVPPGDLGLLAVAQTSRFGSSCLVMSDGSGYMPQTGASCMTDLAQATYSGSVFTATTSCPSIVMMRTRAPTTSPTLLPSTSPSRTSAPSRSPTTDPTQRPSEEPTPAPTKEPTLTPSSAPSTSPTQSPFLTSAPSRSPTTDPTQRPSEEPTPAPAKEPTLTPSSAPSTSPTQSPSLTSSHSKSPVIQPTQRPSEELTRAPSPAATETPTGLPSSNPTQAPSPAPTRLPTPAPTQQPSQLPSSAPTIRSTAAPAAAGSTNSPSSYTTFTMAPNTPGAVNPVPADASSVVTVASLSTLGALCMAGALVFAVRRRKPRLQDVLNTREII